MEKGTDFFLSLLPPPTHPPTHTKFSFVLLDLHLEFYSEDDWPSFQENETTLEGRKKSDAREMQSFYQHYYRKYIQALQNAADKEDR